jgi:hypothetical protein
MTRTTRPAFTEADLALVLRALKSYQARQVVIAAQAPGDQASIADAEGDHALYLLRRLRATRAPRRPARP